MKRVFLTSFSLLVECAQLQLEFLKLYTPECLEIFESLKQMTDMSIDSNTKFNNP